MDADRTLSKMEGKFDTVSRKDRICYFVSQVSVMEVLLLVEESGRRFEERKVFGSKSDH